MTISTKTILMAVAAPALLLATDFNSSSFNEKIKKAGGNIEVIDARPVAGDFYFVSAGSTEKSDYANILVDKEQNIAFVVVGSIPLSKDGEKLAADLSNVVKNVNASAMTAAMRNVPKEAMLFFNGSNSDMSGSTVVIVDPRCPHCKVELEKVIAEKVKNGEKVVVAPVGMLGEESLELAASILTSKDNIEKDFKKLLAYFGADGIKNHTDKEMALAKNASDIIMAIPMVAQTGVPFSYISR